MTLSCLKIFYGPLFLVSWPKFKRKQSGILPVLRGRPSHSVKGTESAQEHKYFAFLHSWTSTLKYLLLNNLHLYLLTLSATPLQLLQAAVAHKRCDISIASLTAWAQAWRGEPGCIAIKRSTGRTEVTIERLGVKRMYNPKKTSICFIVSETTCKAHINLDTIL